MSRAALPSVAARPVAMAALVFALGAAVVNVFARPLPTAVLRRLPVEEFPKRIGAWTCVAEYPTDPAVQKVVPTAVIVDRVYRDPESGREVNLTLLTATDYADFHDPNICFPGQGYDLGAVANLQVAGRSARVMTAERGAERLRIIYWWSGEAAVDTTYGREQVGKLLALRDRMSGKRGQSLFVRVLIVDGGEGEGKADAVLEGFVEAAGPALSGLESAGAAAQTAGGAPKGNGKA